MWLQVTNSTGTTYWLPDQLSFYQMSEHNIVSEPYDNIPIVILSNVIA